MEKKTLNFNKRILSVRRRIDINAPPLPSRPGSPSYRSQLKSGPVGNLAVPFHWERIPGQPKEEPLPESDMPPAAPRPSPYAGAGRIKMNIENCSNRRDKKISHDSADSCHEAAAFVADTRLSLSLSRSQSFFLNCSLNRLIGINDSPCGSFLSDPQTKTQEDLTDRFLPAAKAMEEETSKRSCVGLFSSVPKRIRTLPSSRGYKIQPRCSSDNGCSYGNINDVDLKKKVALNLQEEQIHSDGKYPSKYPHHATKNTGIGSSEKGSIETFLELSQSDYSDKDDSGEKTSLYASVNDTVKHKVTGNVDGISGKDNAIRQGKQRRQRTTIDFDLLPMPKSPSDSWLSRTLPSLFRKKSNASYNGAAAAAANLRFQRNSLV